MPTPPFFDLLNALESFNDAKKNSVFHIVNATYKISIDPMPRPRGLYLQTTGGHNQLQGKIISTSIHS